MHVVLDGIEVRATIAALREGPRRSYLPTASA